MLDNRNDRILRAVNKAVMNGSYINRNLPSGGKIVLDRMTPVLVVYRFSGKSPDKLFQGLVKTQSAYLIAHESQDICELLHTICAVQSERYNSFLIIELWQDSSEDFHIYGPVSKVSATIETLKSGLESLTSRRVGVQVSDTFDRNPPEFDTLLSREQAHKLGVLVIGLEIPHIYSDREKSTVYHLEYRKFRSAFSEALNKAAFDFSRVQTNAGFDHYWRLGKSKINSVVSHVDAQLAETSSRIDLLLRVTPVNEHEEWLAFRNNDFQYQPNFTYRLITIDPEQEKRKLFNIPVEKIDDPTLAQIYREKRNALEKELIMLEERESDRFLTMSQNLIGNIHDETVAQAEYILDNTPAESDLSALPSIGCREFFAAAQNELSRYRAQFGDKDLLPEVRNDITGLMVSRGKLYIDENYDLPLLQCEAMLQHEVGTHILTYCNGKRQPMRLLCRGLANYDELQEGLAVLMEYLADGLTVWRLRTLAARVVAVHAMTNGADFLETFRFLHEDHHFEPEKAFNITGRVFRAGGYTKDAIYLQGLLMLMEYLQRDGDLEILFAGKFALEHVRFIDELIHRGVISEPVLPEILQSGKAQNRLNKIREGMSPLELITEHHENSIHNK